jgi:hypothetical protein
MPRLDSAESQLGKCSNRLTWPATKPTGIYPMGFHPSERYAHRVSFPVAREMDFHPTGRKLACQRLRRKKMPTGPPRGKNERPAHVSLPASRRRVNASIIPMPSPRASKEDPP